MGQKIYEHVVRKTSALIPYANNSRTHSDLQIKQIAASIREFGFTNPVLIDEENTIIAGHGRILASALLNLEEVPCVVLAGLTPLQKRMYVIADNKIALNAGWDENLLAMELKQIEDEGGQLILLGFDDDELDAIINAADPDNLAPMAAPDEAPEVQAIPVAKLGDVFVLGPHRVMCGDSTSPEDAARLMAGAKAHLIHADPPYGMGKENDGVQNDNLYREKLDAFQMAWWRNFRPHLVDNASAYIWGNAPDLWRLWYKGALEGTEKMELRNEIVWDKKNIAGMASPDLTQFPTATERCLFIQIGEQFIGNINKDDFPETWEPLRSYMESQALAAGITSADILRVCGCRMFGHWFSKSQFTLIPEKHHATLKATYPAHFPRPWHDLKAEWDRVKGRGREVINGKLDGSRSYFDNAHDIMRDVWEFPRVIGDERYGHATPKPVAMMERVMISSLPEGGLCIEPFGGTGSTLIGAELTGRVCYTCELTPEYVDVIVRRWQKYTGKDAVLESTGQTFNSIERTVYGQQSGNAS